MMYIHIDQWSLDAGNTYSRSDETTTHGHIQPFKAGQFMLLSTKIDSKQIKRSYSIATTSDYYISTWLIWFSIKRVEWWVFSTRATQVAKQWDQLNLTGPLGHMVDNKENKNYLFISTWSGLSPMLSLFNEIIIEKKHYKKAAFLFGEKKHEHILSSVDSMYQKQKKTDWTNIKMEFFLSKEEKEWYTSWRIQAWLDDALSHLQGLDISCYVCGKPEMVTDILTLLLKKWISKENIKFEKY